MIFFLIFSLFIKDNPLYVDSTLNYLWVENYKEVRKRIEFLKRKLDEKDPLPYLLRTVYLFHFIQDYSSLDSEEVFLESIEKTIELAERYKGDELWGKFCKGGAIAYRAMWFGDKEDYLSAIKEGIKSVNLFTECIKKNFFLKDSYLALGIYNYGTSIIQKYTGKVIFKGERKEKGIKEIEIAYRKGKFIWPLAADALIYIYSREKRRKEAVELAEELYKKFPESRSFLWTIAQAYASRGYWEKAKWAFEKLYENIEKNQKDSPYSRAAVRYWLAKVNYVLNNKEKAKKYLIECIPYLKRANWHRKKYLEKQVENLQKLLK